MLTPSFFRSSHGQLNHIQKHVHCQYLRIKLKTTQMGTGRRTAQDEANYNLNPENMKIKAIESNEYANQA